jgi:hypothetical protein
MPLSLLAASTSASSKTTVIVVDVVISAAVLVFILYRQVQVRRTSPRMVLPIILVIVGVLSLTGSATTSSGKMTGSEVGILIALLVLDAGCLGAVRAWTVKLWHDGQQGVLRQGTWVTILLWLVGLGIHEGVDFAAHIPASSTLLYLGVTMLAQQFALQTRINRMEQLPAGQVWAGQPGPAAFPGPGQAGFPPQGPAGFPPQGPGVTAPADNAEPDAPAGTTGSTGT